VEYLLIVFIIAVVLSPLTWLRSSPGQVRVTAFRKRAAELGLKVQLVPPPDAGESDKQPTAVRYCLAYPEDARELLTARIGQWSLLRHERRGWESPWPEWRWLKKEAAPILQPDLTPLVASLPAQVYCLRAERNTLAAYIHERGELDVVDTVAAAIKDFISQ
jgi:hypothetical protein